jgi:nucleoside-diphosphate-sugar epimerase
MNILITGNLQSLATTLAKDFARDGNKIVLVSEQAEQLELRKRNIIIHSYNPADKIFRDIMSSYKFDVAIYLSVREEQLGGQDFGTSQQLDGLKSTLELCKNERVNRFIYISSTEVYGEMSEIDEGTVPKPNSVNGHTILLGEEICNIYHQTFGLTTIVVRVPFVYGTLEKNTFLFRLLQDSSWGNKVTLPTSGSTACSLLHAEDVASFINLVMEDEFDPSARFVNLSGPNPITLMELTQTIKTYIPNIKFEFDEDNTWYTRPVPVDSAKKIFGWIALRDFHSELQAIVDLAKGESKPRKYDWNWALNELSRYQGFLRWIELMLGVIVAQYLSDFTGIMIQFKYVDFRLLYVILMGLVYGLRFGLFAATLAGASIIFTWSRLGLDWPLLTYNVGNWFPFAVYFAAGVITGYVRDKKETEIENEKKQTSLIYDKYKFLYEVFEEVRELKDEFREQLLGYRDSFGKIYTVTHKLDEMHEEAVFVNALSILEDLISNDTVAIYSLDSTKAYARLEVNSLALNEKIEKSIKLEDFPEILASVGKGEIYQNTSLLTGYPAYVAPIYTEESLVALVFIWNAKFDQYTMYYYNLFKVITGLIQDSLVRASLFREANLEKIYFPSTRVLKPEAFVDVLKRRVYMKKDKVANYQLLWVKKNGRSIQGLYSQISGAIRTADVVGMRYDGNVFIVLPQADQAAVEAIIKRLKKKKVECELVGFLS